ncbi:HlyD family secretion protein [Pedobacter endophyticus]|uniref:HlyD family efflux transporter periplasmic adaptor subunit n=1 Tax=Pedobacter endophyticus TaxID=2789740 RepID=A0A7U3Q417_9SPHI|nr:HlyD family efflux transporter periplasmic adaptor subunit [Pedobacter endophyticus]QPH38205.1 HlyD family efflux transporter periplasmic adaptor subunit [Pedobacter endophyticus]
MSIISETEFNNTSLIFLHQTRVRSQIIYVTVVVAIFAALAALPFLYTAISVTGSGAIQSNIEKAELLAPASGRITEVNLIDNRQVTKGTQLLTIDASLANQQKNLIGNHQSQLQQQLNDALTLLKFKNNPNLQTPLYLAAWQQYTEALQNAANAKEQAFKVYQRYKTLIDKKVVTQAEFEQYHFNYKQALSDYEMVTKKYKTQWQTEANQYRNELRDLKNQNIQINDQVKQYILKAPINGSLQNLTGIQNGSFVYANQKLGEISPDSLLLAFCYVKPADIGLIKKGQQVRFQIDAFNYNQWGLLSGIVLDIANDIIIENQTPYFKVKCKLDQDYLQLKNGYKGHVKKGMTFTARFTVTKRSFYQLLYDNVDDWLNPNGV